MLLDRAHIFEIYSFITKWQIFLYSKGFPCFNHSCPRITFWLCGRHFFPSYVLNTNAQCQISRNKISCIPVDVGILVFWKIYEYITLPNYFSISFSLFFWKWVQHAKKRKRFLNFMSKRIIFIFTNFYSFFSQKNGIKKTKKNPAFPIIFAHIITSCKYQQLLGYEKFTLIKQPSAKESINLNRCSLHPPK